MSRPGCDEGGSGVRTAGSRMGERGGLPVGGLGGEVTPRKASCSEERRVCAAPGCHRAALTLLLVLEANTAASTWQVYVLLPNWNSLAL